MKILKRYILELCFILSFALPFTKGANADNGRCFVETYYGFTFLMEHAIVTAVFICSILIAFLLILLSVRASKSFMKSLRKVKISWKLVGI